MRTKKMTSGLTLAMTLEMSDEIKRILDEKEVSQWELARDVLQEYLDQNKTHVNGGHTNEYKHTNQDRG